jgi:uncharacterized protein
MDLIYKSHQLFLKNTKTVFERSIMQEVDWTDRLIGIKGARGVGKTTFIAQHIKKEFKNSQAALYISMDNLELKSKSLFEIAEKHLNLGGTHLFVDEVHKYPDWSFALKNIYDLLPQLNVVFSGSSLLAIHQSKADLSRRTIMYQMPGLSLREYINIEYDKNLESINLDDILNNHIEIANDISNNLTIIKFLNEYLQYGYYPFFLEGKKKYNQRLQNIINTVLEVDMLYATDCSIQNVFKVKKFLHMIATSVPFEPNISKLAGSLEMSRNTLNNFIYYLDEADILNVLLSSGKSYSHISKPEKLYMDNTNLINAIHAEHGNEGTIREVFFLNQVKHKHQVNYSKHGDFLVSEKYTFEVGGKNKTYSQIANIENSFIVSDELITGLKNKIPLWLFGFLY